MEDAPVYCHWMDLLDIFTNVMNRSHWFIKSFDIWLHRQLIAVNCQRDMRWKCPISFDLRASGPSILAILIEWDGNDVCYRGLFALSDQKEKSATRKRPHCSNSWVNQLFWSILQDSWRFFRIFQDSPGFVPAFSMAAAQQWISIESYRSFNLKDTLSLSFTYIYIYIYI